MRTPLAFSAGLSWLASSVLAAEPTVLSAPTPLSGRAAVAASFRYDPSLHREPEKPFTSPVILRYAEESPVILSPFVVKDQRDRPIVKAIDAAVAQEHRLESHALFKFDLTKRVRLEIFPTPSPGKNGGIYIPVIMLSW